MLIISRRSAIGPSTVVLQCPNAEPYGARGQIIPEALIDGSFFQFLSALGQAIAKSALGLATLGIPFLVLAEVLKRLPGTKNGNFQLAHREHPFFNRELPTELALPLLNTIFLIPLGALQGMYFIDLILASNLPHQAFDQFINAWPIWVQVLAGMVILDFTLYVRHRFVHYFCWPYHTIHHSAKEIGWLTWIRLHPLDIFFMGLIATWMLHVIGFSGEAFAMASVINGHFNRFNHSNIQLDYPAPLRYILVSPNMHRWHHAADDPRALNKNFCIVFAWIDLILGTFYVPRNRLPTRYGVGDDRGSDVAPPGYINQLLYPFRHHALWLGRHWRRLRSQSRVS